MRTRKQELDTEDVATRADAAYNWWTTREMARRACGVSDRQVRAWIKSGKLRPEGVRNIAVGKTRKEYRIDPIEGERFIREEMAA